MQFPVSIEGVAVAIILMDFTTLNPQVYGTPTSPGDTGEEARWPKQQHDVRFCFSGEDCLGIPRYLDIPLCLLRGTVIEDCLQDCGGTTEKFGTIMVPSSIDFPSLDEVFSYLQKWQTKLDNPTPQYLLYFDDKIPSIEFLDFLGVNFKHYIPQYTHIHFERCAPTYLDKGYYGYDSCDDTTDGMLFDEDKPRRATKKRIQEQRLRQQQYDPCEDNIDYYEDCDTDEKYAKWIESLNIDERDFTL